MQASLQHLFMENAIESSGVRAEGQQPWQEEEQSVTLEMIINLVKSIYVSKKDKVKTFLRGVFFSQVHTWNF